MKLEPTKANVSLRLLERLGWGIVATPTGWYCRDAVQNVCMEITYRFATDDFTVRVEQPDGSPLGQPSSPQPDVMDAIRVAYFEAGVTHGQRGGR